VEEIEEILRRYDGRVLAEVGPMRTLAVEASKDAVADLLKSKRVTAILEDQALVHPF